VHNTVSKQPENEPTLAYPTERTFPRTTSESLDRSGRKKQERVRWKKLLGPQFNAQRAGLDSDRAEEAKDRKAD